MWKVRQQIKDINELVNYAKVTSATSIDVPKEQLEIFNHCFNSYIELCNRQHRYLTKTQIDLIYHFQYLHIFDYQRYLGLNKLCDLVPNEKLKKYLKQKPTQTFLRNTFVEYPNMTFREWQDLAKWHKLQTAKTYYALNQKKLAMAEINGYLSERNINESEKEECVQYIKNEAANALNELGFPTRSPEESVTESETKNALNEPARAAEEEATSSPKEEATSSPKEEATSSPKEEATSSPKEEATSSEATRSPEEPNTKDKRFYSVSVDPRPPTSSSPTTKWLLFGGILLGVIAGIAVLVRTKTKFKIKNRYNLEKLYEINKF